MKKELYNRWYIEKELYIERWAVESIEGGRTIGYVFAINEELAMIKARQRWSNICFVERA